MPVPSDEALARCDLNLYAADKEWLYRRYGHGWSEVVRKLVRDFRKQKEAEQSMNNMDVQIDYTNHRGERNIRYIRPIQLTWGLSEYHEGVQWILLAQDLNKNASREFAMKDIHSWLPCS